jgi:DNA-directed RNA polymerase specialized sigma24 family protein
VWAQTPALDEAKTRCTADAVARRSYYKLVALLAARTRDVASVEDALSEAFASALAHWPVNGCPSKPEAWLLTAARQKMIDVARRRSGAAAAGQVQVLAKEFDARGGSLGNPGPSSRADVLLCASGHRGRHPRALERDPAVRASCSGVSRP